MPLSHPLRQEITEFLMQRPNFANENGRKALLYNAGQEWALAALDLHGSQQDFVNALIQQCDAYGTVDGATPALVALLRSLKGQVGPDIQHNIEELCCKVIIDYNSTPADASKSQPSGNCTIPQAKDQRQGTKVDYDDFAFIVQKMQRDDPFVASKRDKDALMRILSFYNKVVYKLDFYKMSRASQFLFLRHKRLERMIAMAEGTTIVATIALTLLALWLMGKLAL